MAASGAVKWKMRNGKSKMTNKLFTLRYPVFLNPAAIPLIVAASA